VSDPEQSAARSVEHNLIGPSAVLLREDNPGDKWRLAYIISAAETLPETGAKCTWLKDQVPEYMVPSTFVIRSGRP